MDLTLWPVHLPLACVGGAVLAGFVAHGVEGGLCDSDPAPFGKRLPVIAGGFRIALPQAGPA